VRREIHLNLKQADFDYERVQYNTVVSAAMKMLNALEDARPGDSPAEAALAREGLGILLRVLYPIAPHITHALWQELGFAAVHGDLLDAPWPAADEAALRQDEIELVVQVNGKLRGSVRVPAAADRQAIEAAALADPAVQRFVAGSPVRRVVVVPGKLVNVVV
jgi:leucyl-tRNA synthetase